MKKQIRRRKMIKRRHKTTPVNGNLASGHAKMAHECFEPLEPRVLLSASLLDLPADIPAIFANTVSSAPVLPGAALGDRVWRDHNANGIQDDGEPGILGVQVALSGADDTGNPVSAVQDTGADGRYTFDGLEPGIYSLAFTLPDDFVFTSPNQGSDSEADSNAVVLSTVDNTDLVAQFEFDEGMGTIATDSSGQGQDNSGTVVGDPQWNSDGTLTFDGIDDRVLLADSSDINLGIHAQRTIYVRFMADDVSAGKQVIYEEGGEFRGLSIYIDGGNLYVGGWNTPTGESGWAGTFLSTTVTEGEFHDVVLVLDGQPALTADALAAYVDGDLVGSGSGSQLWGHSDNVGIGASNQVTRFHDGPSSSDGSFFAGTLDELRVYNRALNSAEIQTLSHPGSIGVIESVVLERDQIDDSLDAGMILTGAALGDRVWRDHNANGIQDDGEPGILGVQVALSGADDTGNPVSAVQDTGPDGRYTFDGLEPGIYSLAFTLPDDFVFTSPNQGSDSEADSNAVVLSTVDNTDLVAQFEFDEGMGTIATDSSGQGQDNSGTVVGDPQWNSDGTLTLDGIDDRVLLADSSDINLGIHAQRTIYVRFMADDVSAGKQVIYEEGGEFRGLSIYIDGGNLYVGGWNTPTGESGWAGTFLSTTVTEGEFHDVVLVLDGQPALTADALAAYVDGDLVGSGSGSQLWGHSDNVGIGASNQVTRFHDGPSSSDGSFFAGTLDELRVYNRALNSAEIQTLSHPGSIGVIESVVLERDQIDDSLDAGMILTGIDIEKSVRVVSMDNEGLSHGFWKTHSRLGPAPEKGWLDTGFDPDDNFNTVFGVSDGDDLTLHQALKRGGGGLNALGRQAVAAILNAAHPNIHYALTQTEVIERVQTAYASDHKGEIETIKDKLETQNKLEADLKTPIPTVDDWIVDPGEDADVAPGVIAKLSEKIVFVYTVTNPGDVPLADVVIVDDNTTPDDPADDFNPSPVDKDGNNIVDGDENEDGLLDPGEVWFFTAMDVVTAGEHASVATVTGTPVDADGQALEPVLTDEDPAFWFGQFDAEIDLEKFVQGVSDGIDTDSDDSSDEKAQDKDDDKDDDKDKDKDDKAGAFGKDADEAPGVRLDIGSTVRFTYVVRNRGDVELGGVEVTDDNTTPDDTSDDFSPAAVDDDGDGFNDGDTDRDNRLDPGERWRFVAVDQVTEGQHTNVATAVGTPIDEDGSVLGPQATDQDPANWLGADGEPDDGSDDGPDSDKGEPHGPRRGHPAWHPAGKAWRSMFHRSVLANLWQRILPSFVRLWANFPPRS